MRVALASVAVFVLAACSQEPAMVDMRGEQYFGKEPVNIATSMSAQEYRAANEPAVDAMPTAGISSRSLDDPTKENAPQERIASAPLEPLAPMAEPPAAAPASGMTHRVAPGETLYRISRNYGVSVDEMRQINGLSDNGLSIGQELRLPQHAQLAQAAPPQPSITSDEAVAQSLAPRELPAPAATGTAQFIWPAKGDVVQAKAVKGGHLYTDGVNIMAAEGDPVKAAANGTVVHAGAQLEGYGNLVIVKHADGWLSAYAHTQNPLVKKGEKVAQGQTIAYVGKTGHVDKAQLHFSLRQGKDARDPIAILGEPGKMAAAQ